jgi:hypothetical protein
MKNCALILLSLAAAACTTKSNSALIITKVVAPTVITSGTPPVTTCSVDAGSTETSFLRLNPAENVGQVGLVVQNTIAPTSSVNPALHTDASTFVPEQTVIDYELIPTLGSNAQSLGQKVIPTTGVLVPGGASVGTVAVIMVPPGVLSATIKAGTFVRTTFHIEGKLADGSSVHTSEREYLFEICTTAGCAANVCL